MEPERDIEKQLKAYAKKRREEAGAPMKMHPATRRMLQSEATRLSNRKADKSDWRRTLARLWPRLALTTSIFVLLAIGSWALLFNRPDSESKFSLALKHENTDVRSREESLRKNVPRTDSPALAVDLEQKADRSQTLSLSSTAESAATTYGFDSGNVSNGADIYYKTGDLTSWSAPASASSSLILTNSSISQPRKELPPIGTKTEVHQAPANSLSSVTRKRNEIEAETPARMAATPAAPSFEDRAGQDKKTLTSLDDSAKLGESQRRALAEPTPVPAPGANRQSYAAADLTPGALGGALIPTEKAATITQTFSRVNKDFNGQSTLRDDRKNLVLDNFSLEQSKNSIRVVDADGSIYTGSVQTVAGKPASLRLSDELSQAPKQKSQVASVDKPQRRPGVAGKEEEALLKQDNFLYFSVSGTNRTLNQSVVFTGGFVALTNGVPATNRIAGFTNVAKIAPSGAAAALAPSAPQLRGQAIIGGSNQLKIDALQVNPKK